jgi:pimeloyl-ACP methyl ester carboxylesterase
MKASWPVFVILLSAALARAQTSAPAETQFAADSPTAKAMAELFAQDDPVTARIQQHAVLQTVGNDLGQLKAAIASDTAYEKLSPGWVRKTVPVTGREKKKVELEYVFRVPNGYDPKKSWPVMFIFHGQGSNGEMSGKMTAALIGQAADKFILVAPTQAGSIEHFDGSPLQEQSCLAPLAYVRTHLNVDDDRIFLTGYSLGGHQTWHMATMYPRLWAAAVPMAGIPWFEGSPFTNTIYLENLAHLPLWAIWGELDHINPKSPGNVGYCRMAEARFKELNNQTFTGTEIAGGGHGDCWPKPADFLKFLEGKKRQLPTSFEHYFHMRHHARGYWLEATNFTFTPLDLSKAVSVTVSTKDPKVAQDAAQKFVSGKLFQFSGLIDAESNTITIKGVGIRTARLYLIDGMVDLSKPVTIRYLGSTWKGKIATSPDCVLKNYAATRDQTQLIVNEVDLRPDGRATARYK